MDDKNKNAIEIYDLVAKDYAKAFDSIESEADFKFLNIFLSHLKPGSNIVDLGCGAGFSTDYFVKNGMRASGVDLSKSMVDIAQTKYPYLTFLVMDMRVFVPDGLVAAVWAGYSLFHFEQTGLEETIEKIKSYLLPRGVFGLVVQGGSGEVEPPETFLPERSIYIHLYTEEKMAEILAKHGFEVVDSSVRKPTELEFPYDKILLIARLK